ncbi:SulP family inorganic anion transporter [Gemmata sp.]|uniref:SulP family inorganic anion transporter n=1 Tax=Gemmata sp. TaxID=1914242 RepID=UPI003F714EAA
MADHKTSHAAPPRLTPGLVPNLRFDVPSGFLVFLIAMPLCLGIASASQYPPIAGIWTAVIGGVLTAFLSNSQVTIKGPAAGLIVIVSGAVLDLGLGAAPAGTDPADLATLARYGYPLALGIGVAAGVVQILFGVMRAAKVGEVIPLTPVHGMLAAIGITIMAKQFFVMFGLTAPAGAPIDSIHAVPTVFRTLDPTVSWIGGASLAIMIAFPLLKTRVALLRPVPAQVVVVAVAIPMGLALGLDGVLNDKGAAKFLVSVPNVVASPAAAFAFPDFTALATPTGIKYVVLFALVGSIESMLSSQAIDMIDPWQRKTDQNRDLLAVGVANALCSAVGALPMISEIVRSKANIDNGARTRYANLFHGLFLLAFILLLPFVVTLIPLAALGAMLVFTGFRLASPREFVSTYKVGAEQLVVFVTTIVVVLCTDLLIGVAAGVALKVVIHVLNGAPLSSFLRADVEVATTDDGSVVVLKVRKAALFANWLGLKASILKHAAGRTEVVLDLSETKLVDHSTMEKLHQLERDLAATGKRLKVIGLDTHTALSHHPLAARRSGRVDSPVAV